MDKSLETNPDNMATPAGLAKPVAGVSPDALQPRLISAGTEPTSTPSATLNAPDLQQQQPLSAADETGKWKQLVGAAKAAWGKLTIDELFKSEGNEQKLAMLVQQRYAIRAYEADKQVRNFLARHKS